MSEEWGPWKDHHGGKYPGNDDDVVQVEFRMPPPFGNASCFADPDCDLASAWAWRHDGTGDDIVRYRFRKPRAMVKLQDMIADLPAPTERVGA